MPTPSPAADRAATVLDDRLVNTATACAFLGCGRTKVWKLRKAGELPTVYLGDTNKLRFRMSDLRALVKRGTVTPETAGA